MGSNPEEDRIEKQYQRLTKRIERKKKLETAMPFKGLIKKGQAERLDTEGRDEVEEERLDWEYRRLTKRVERKKHTET